MMLFIDDARVAEIRCLCAIYPMDGVTTNPTLLERAGGDPVATLREIRDVIGPERLLFAQAIPTDAEGMIRDARALAGLLGPTTVVKLPAVPEGFKAMRALLGEGIATCGTVVLTPMQAFLAAKAGAAYVAPYVNRVDDMGYDGVAVTRQTHDILALHRLPTRVLAASFRNTRQVLELCAHGIAAVTCAPSVIEAFAKSPAVDAAIDGFSRDFAALAGEDRSMADLIG